MKKLSVLLLATALVFGLVVQAGAQGPHLVSKDVFAADPVITFDDFASAYDPNTYPDGYECWLEIPPVLISDQYRTDYGVSFSGELYGEHNYAPTFISQAAASNFNICDLFSGDNSSSEPFEPIKVIFDEPVTRVGFFGFTLHGAITVTPFRDGVATASLEPVPTDIGNSTFIGIEDLEGIDAIMIEGDGAAFRGYDFWIDDLTFGGTLDTGPTEIEVTMNVNPPSCSGASLNMKSKGVTPVVIAGSADFDVTMIDPASIQLNGVAPVRSAIEDVPYCNNTERDGFLDLTLKFNTQELVDAMTASLAAEGVTLENDDWASLHLTGSLLDETAIYADEPVCVKGKPAKENQSKGKKRSFKSHSRHDRGHHKGWDHNRGHHKGWDHNR